MDELLYEYRQTFGENFPLFMMMSEDEDKVKSIIKECLEDGEPYEPDIIEGVKY